MRRLIAVVVLAFIPWACAGAQTRTGGESAPAFLVGEFIDDYGIRYSIHPDRWFQHPDARYHLREWHVEDRFVVAENDSENPGDGRLWTRIDWVALDDAGEYEWAFCYAVYQAATREDAGAAQPTRGDTPRTGCNGFPFSRMKRVAPTRR